MPLRLSCLEEGFTLDIEDDQWSSPNLSTSFAQLVKLQCDEEEDAVNKRNTKLELENPKQFLNPDILLVRELNIVKHFQVKTK